MSDKQIKAKFNTLTEAEQKRIHQEAAAIRKFGANAFWIETGSHADDPANYWYVIGFVMAGRS